MTANFGVRSACISFNPCFNGITLNTEESDELTEYDNSVSILVLME